MTQLSRLEQVRDRLPGAAAQLTQFVVDNPGQMVMIGAGTIVLTRAAFNLVRPRTALEALALFTLLQISLPHLAMLGIEKGWLNFKLRDPAGCLVPLRLGLSDATDTAPAPGA